MRPRTKRRLLVATVLLAGAIGLFLAGWFPQAPLRRGLEGALRGALGPGASVGGLRVVPGRLYAELRDVRISTVAYDVTLPSVEVAFAPATLLGRDVALRALVVRGPSIVLRETTSTTPASSPAVAPVIPYVGRLEVTDGRVVYLMASGAQVELADVDLRGGVRSVPLDLTIGTLAWRPTEGPGIEGNVTGRAAIGATGVTVERLAASAGPSTVSLAGTVSLLPGHEMDVRADLHLDAAQAATFAGGPAASGAVGVQARAKGPAETARLEADIRSESLSLADVPVRLSGRMAGTVDAAETALQAEALGGRAEVKAALKNGDVNAQLSLRQLDVAALLRLAGSEPTATGRIDGDLALRGPLAGTLQATGRIAVEGVAAGGPVSLAASAEGRVEPTAPSWDLAWKARAESLRPDLTLIANAEGTARPARIEAALDTRVERAGMEAVTLAGNVQAAGTAIGLVLEGGGALAPLHIEGHLAGTRIEELNVDSDGLDLGRLVQGAGGDVAVHLRASGEPKALNAEGALTMRDLRWAGADLGPVALRVEIAGGEGPITLRADALKLAVDGSLQKDVLTARVTLAETPLSPLAAAGGTSGVAGSVTAVFDASVPLSAPERAQAQGTVDRLKVEASDVTLDNDGPVRIEYRDRVVRLTDAVLVAPGARLAASAVVPLDAGPLQAEATAEIDASRFPLPVGWTVGGTPIVHLRATGTLERPVVSGNIVLRGLAASGPGVPPLTIDDTTLPIEDGVLQIPSLIARLAGGTLDVSGRVPFLPAPGADKNATLDARWDELDAGQLSPGTGLSGRVAGTLHVEGPLADPVALRAELRMPALGLSVQDLPLEISAVVVDMAGGRLTVAPIALTAGASRLDLAGSADLGRRTLNAKVDGSLDLRALTPFLTDMALAGSAQVDVAVSGSFDAPGTRGTLVVEGARARFRDVPQPLTDVGLRATFDGSRVAVTDGRATLGGGALALSGGAALAGAGLKDIDFTVTAQDVALRYPFEVKSRSDAQLRLTGTSEQVLLSGRVAIERAVYDTDIYLDQSLTAVAPAAASPALRAIALDLEVDFVRPFRVDNNVADLNVEGRLRVRGDAAQPAPFGRLVVVKGGKIIFQQRTLEVGGEGTDGTPATIEYEGTLDPTLDIEASVEIEESNNKVPHVVRVAVTGRLEAPAVTLEGTSNAPLTQEQALSLLLTGQRNGLSSENSQALGNQAATLLAGRFNRQIERQLQRLGFDTVEIDPSLLARDQDAGGKFTFGKRLSERVLLVYSAGLDGPEKRYFELRLGPVRAFDATAQRREDGGYRSGFRRSFELGGPPDPPDAGASDDDRRRIADVRAEGLPGAVEADVLPDLRDHVGERRSVWDLEEEADLLRRRLVERGYLEAEASARLQGDVATFEVHAGRRYTWRIEGMASPPDIGPTLRESLFAEDAVERARTRLRDTLHRRGYVRGEVDGRIEPQGDDAAELVFTAVPGPQYRRVAVDFDGAVFFSEGRLAEVSGGAGALIADPAGATGRVAALYQSAHFLAVELGAPQVTEEAGLLRITVPVREGPRAVVAAVRFEGAKVADEVLAGYTIDLPGTVPDELAIAEATDRLRRFYFSRGYAEVQVTPRLSAAGSDVELVFGVREGPKAEVAAIEVRGTTRLSEGIVKREMGLEVGDALDPVRVSQAESRLRALGFASVGIQLSDNGEATTLTVEARDAPRLVAELKPYYDSATGVGGEAVVRFPHLLPNGFTPGALYRQEAGPEVDRAEARAWVSMPALFHRGTLTASASRIETDTSISPDPDTGAPRFNNDRLRTIDLQQTAPLGTRWELFYGYQFRRVAFTSPLFGFPIETDVGGINLGLVQDTRDNPLDATRGRFWTVNLKLAPTVLGPDFNFVKGFARAAFHRPLTEGLTWSQSYQLGLAHTFSEGRFLVSFERFRAGGASSVRGFAFESLGPRDDFGDPRGGQAVLVLNQELRYRYRWGLGAAVFYDAGDVYATVSEIKAPRHSAGLGLRYTSPVGLIRADLGFPFGTRQEGEKAYQLFIAIGQAF